MFPLEDDSGIDLETLTALARRCAERGMLDEAAELFQLALRFDPKNLGVQLNLAQVRNQLRQRQGRQRRNAEEAMLEQMRRNAIDASHFFGLAALYEERGKRDQAVECLEIARSKEIINPFIPKLSGRIHFRRQQYDAASRELRRARRYNPFDRESADLLSRSEYERENYLAALEAAIDAFLLLHDDDLDGANQLKKRIRTLKSIQQISSEDLVALFRERREKLQTDFDRLEWQRARFLRATPADLTEITPQQQDSGKRTGRLDLATRLRRLDAWERLNDEEIFTLTQAAREETYRKGSKIVDYGSASTDLFLLEKGRVAVRRPTHYGTFHLGVLRPGHLFGEVNFISHCERSADAVASEDCHLIRIDADELGCMIGDDPAFGLAVFSSFWHGLAEKLRAANEQLRTFFSDAAASENLFKLRATDGPAAGKVEVRSDDKIRLFREQGLSGKELDTLANFSDAHRYPSGTFIFHEGDKGDEMYIVLDGRVMISKYIPGGGEEALAILERGDFFGEMALFDGQPRSADAKAFEGPATLVALNDKTMSEIMAMDAGAALDFMKLLCLLIAKRLREIDEKVTSWRIMSGARPLEDEAPLEQQRSA